MKILVVQESDWLRRNPHQQHQMLERLSTWGHEVVVIDYPIRWRDDDTGLIAPRRVHHGIHKVVDGANITVIRSAMPRIAGVGKLGWLLTNTIEIRRAMASWRPDVVVCLGLSNGYVALKIAAGAGVPVVVHLIDALHTLAEPRSLRPIARYVEREVLRHADAVVAINHALVDYARSFGADRTRVVRIPTGIDPARFAHVDGSALRQSLGIQADEWLLLYVGWLYTFSGVREVAHSLALHKPDNVRLVVVGDGDLYPELVRLRDRQLGARLILTGHQPSELIPQYVAAADVCLLPAQLNATMAHIVPAKLYDYLAGGKPVIATALPGIMREFGRDAGVVFAASPESVIPAATALFARRDGLVALEASARATASNLGTWDSVSQQFISVLDRVREHPRVHRPAA